MVTEYKTLRILFEVPEPDAGIRDGDDWLRLEQVEHEKPPISGMMDWLDRRDKGLALPTILEYFSQYNSACDDSGCLEIEVQVHKSRGDLDYTIIASYGELSSRFVHEGQHTTSYTVEMEDSIDLDVLVTGMISAEWEGEVIAEDGSFLNPKPEITVDGSIISFGQSLAGVIRLTYTEQHDTYVLTIEPRPAEETDSEDPESAYQSTVMAVWGDGNVEVLEISLPDMEGNCSGARWIVNPDDDEEKCIRLIEVRDSCTEELISSREEQIECPEEESA